jgi:hypothetical protein
MRLSFRAAELVALVALLGVQLLTYNTADLDPFIWSGVYPLLLAAILSFSLIFTLRYQPSDLLGPLFWFRATSVVYFGFGASLLVFGSDAVQARMLAFYNATTDEIARATIVVLASLTVTLAVANWVAGPYNRGAARNWQLKLPKSYTLLALVFIAVGGSIRYFMQLPYQFGESEFTSGLFVLSNFLPLGLILLFAIYWEERGPYFWFAMALFVLNLLIGVLTFSKYGVVLALLTFFLPYVLVKPTVRRFSVCASAVFLAYLLSNPLVIYGREAIVAKTGSIARGSLADRFDVIARFMTEGHVTDAMTGTSGLSRLSYITAQAFAVAEYDRGRPSDSLENLRYVLVPRILYPEKPIISSVGEEMNVRVFRRRGSHVSPTIPAEAYFLNGWWGVAFWMSIYGAGLGAMQRISRWLLTREQYVYMPVILGFMMIGMRTDGGLLVDFFGQIPILAFLGLGLFLAQSAMLLLAKPRWAIQSGAGRYPRRFSRVQSL